MPYAANRQLSKSPLVGGIEISDEQYREAILAAQQGQRIVVKGGAMQLLSSEKRTVYSTDDGAPLAIFEDDETPEGYTDTERPSEFHEWLNGEWYESPEGALSRAKAKANKRINAAYQAELNAILRDYPDAETKTWDKQESEARAHQSDNTAPTPLIDAIASARNMDKAELVQRVIAKADAWISLSGAATGKRQALEDAIADAETVGAADAINW